MARWLKLSVSEKLKRRFPIDMELKEDIHGVLLELDLPPGSSAVGKPVVKLQLPKTTLIVLIHRDGKYLSPNGDTILEAEDHLMLMLDNKDDIDTVYASFDVKKSKA
jgi:cell volume regulation protein A